MMTEIDFNINDLIDIVSKGGTIKTGIDVYDKDGILLLDKDECVNKISTLLILKDRSITTIKVDPKKEGGVWDPSGNHISGRAVSYVKQNKLELFDIEKKIQEIYELKKEAGQKYQKAKKCLQEIISEIRASGGHFDYQKVKETVEDLCNFLLNKKTAFSYFTKDILSSENYLYNHAINNCAIGTAVLREFNIVYSASINKFLAGASYEVARTPIERVESYMLYYPEELHEISLGYFIHDIGKILVPEEILQKGSKLTETEFDLIKKHSYQKGIEILSKNNLRSLFISNIVKYHHAALFKGETNSYPEDKTSIEIPPYVKICKLVDMYDAMTSKRVYEDAFNPIGVVTDIFRKYAGKDHLLQFILHAFIKVVGIFPAGSIVFLRNGQFAYVIDSQGPVVVPFTDCNGKTITGVPAPIHYGQEEIEDKGMLIDKRRPPTSPREVHALLPEYLRELLKLEK